MGVVGFTSVPAVNRKCYFTQYSVPLNITAARDGMCN